MNKLMIVEDEKMIRQGIRAIAARSGVPIDEIIECKNGEEALEILQCEKIDVMITDIRMPKMDGITLVKEMKKYGDPPQTVVISGYDDFSYAVELLRQGVREYILKPIEREKIVEILEKLEVELCEKWESQEQHKKIGFQQIKYVLLNSDIGKDELDIIERQYHDIFYHRPYRVACTNVRAFNQEPVKIDDVLVLKDVDKQTVFILNSKRYPEFQTEAASYYVGVSREYEGIGELRKAYREAVAAREMSFCLEKKLFEYKDEKPEYDLIEEDEISRIVQEAGGQNIDELKKELKHIIYRAKRGNISPGQLAEAMESLIDRIYRTYKNVMEMDMESGDKLKEIFSYATATEYFDAFCSWIEQFHRGMISELEDYKNKQKIQEALNYIQKNYTKDLNMAVVSNYVSMNYSLFSFTFKQYTGMNFVYFLKKIRIDEAKRLLKNTDLKVADIAQKVGYDNEKYFMKTFKSVCGVSATEYRRNTTLK